MNEREIAQIVTATIKQFEQEKEVRMTLSIAKEIIRKVILKAEEIGVKAVVAVSDGGANPVCVECMDDSYIASYDIAVNKAFTVVSLKMPTKDLKTLAAPGGSLYGIQFTNDRNGGPGDSGILHRNVYRCIISCLQVCKV